LQKKKAANAAADSPESDKHQSVGPNEQQKYIGRTTFDKREFISWSQLSRLKARPIEMLVNILINGFDSSLS
jgi:hypothetical protein